MLRFVCGQQTGEPRGCVRYGFVTEGQKQVEPSQRNVSTYAVGFKNMKRQSADRQQPELSSHTGVCRFEHDTQTGMLPGYPESAICVQRFDDSLNSAIHTTYRNWLRSSSMHEPRDPPLEVVNVCLNSNCTKQSEYWYESVLKKKQRSVAREAQSRSTLKPIKVTSHADYISQWFLRREIR